MSELKSPEVLHCMALMYGSPSRLRSIIDPISKDGVELVRMNSSASLENLMILSSSRSENVPHWVLNNLVSSSIDVVWALGVACLPKSAVLVSCDVTW